MSLTVAYARSRTGIVVWLMLVRKLSAKSWEAQPAAATRRSTAPRCAPARVGLWIFLAVITSLFGLFISAYYMRMGRTSRHGPGAGLGAADRAAGAVAEHAAADPGQRRDAVRHARRYARADVGARAELRCCSAGC